MSARWTFPPPRSNQLRDYDPDALRLILSEVANEVAKATHRFPPFNSAHEGYAVIAEELDELWDEVKRNDTAAARTEAIQVAAMAVRFLLDVPDPPAAQENKS